MGIKRKIEIWQWDNGQWQILTRTGPSDIPFPDGDGTYMSDPIALNELIEKLKWIDEHRDKVLEKSE